VLQGRGSSYPSGAAVKSTKVWRYRNCPAPVERLNYVVSALFVGIFVFMLVISTAAWLV